MHNRGMRKYRRSRLFALVFLVSAAMMYVHPSAPHAEQRFLESFFCKVYYDDAGSKNDDNLAYWLTHTSRGHFASWNEQDAATIDWSFLYALWGLGWDKMWEAPGGIADTWKNQGKLPVYLVDEGDTGTYGYNNVGEWGVYLNYAHYPKIMSPTDLISGDPSSNPLVNDADGDGRPDEDRYDEYFSQYYSPVWNLGSVAAHETSHAMYGQYVGDWFTGRLDNDYYYHGFLTESLAWYAGSMLWPAGDVFHEDLESVRNQYRLGMKLDDYDYTSWGQAEWSYRHAETAGPFFRGAMTFLGVGYLLSNWDALGFGSASNSDYYVKAWSESNVGSVYRVFDLLTYLRNDPERSDFSGAFAYAYDGLKAKMNGLTYKDLDPDSGDLNAWLYYLMWEEWSGAS